MAMNNHHTTEDPKNIRMTEEERSTLYTRIMKHVGMPEAQFSPIKVHPSPWFSAAAFKPVFLALFLLMISTSGVLLYQERAIKENKNDFIPLENQSEQQVPNETADTKIVPANTAVQQKTFQAPKSESTVAPMLMNADITTHQTSQSRSIAKKEMNLYTNQQIYAKDDGYNDFALILKQDGDLISLRYVNVLDNGNYINASDENDYAATFKTDDIKDDQIILSVKNYRFFDPQEYVKIKLIFNKNAQTVEWVSLDKIAPYLPQQIVLQKI
jgi:hypothetical protein